MTSDYPRPWTKYIEDKDGDHENQDQDNQEYQTEVNQGDDTKGNEGYDNDDNDGDRRSKCSTSDTRSSNK